MQYHHGDTFNQVNFWKVWAVDHGGNVLQILTYFK